MRDSIESIIYDQIQKAMRDRDRLKQEINDMGSLTEAEESSLDMDEFIAEYQTKIADFHYSVGKVSAYAHVFKLLTEEQED